MHVFQNFVVDLLAGGLLDLLPHQIGGPGLDLLPHLLLGHLHDLGADLLLGPGVHQRHHLGVGRVLHLLAELGVGLLVDVVLHVVQQLGLEAFDLLLVVVDGDVVKLDIQLLKVLFLLVQLVVGGIDDALEDLPRAVHQVEGIAVDLLQAVGQRARAVPQLIRAVLQIAGAVLELLGAVVQLLRAVLEALGAVLELVRALPQVGSAVPQVLRAVAQLLRAVLQGLDAVHDLLGAVVQLGRAVVELLSAVVQLLRAVPQVLRAVVQIARAVVELLGAVVQLFGAVPQVLRAVAELVRAVQQLLDGVGQVVAQLVDVEVLQIVQRVALHVQLFKPLVQRDDVDAGVGIVRHVRGDGGGGGQVDVQVVEAIQVQRVADAREAHADGGLHAADVHQLAVFDIHVLVDVGIHEHEAGGQEGQGNFFLFAAHVRHYGLGGGGADFDLQMAALALQIRGGNLLAVQLVGDAHVHGQGLVAGALVVDVVAVGLPGDHAVLDGEGLAAADIFDVVQGAVVRQHVQLVVVVQPIVDHHAGGIAVGVGHDEHGLLLLRQRVRRDGAQPQRACGDDGCAALQDVVHMSEAPFKVLI